MLCSSAIAEACRSKQCLRSCHDRSTRAVQLLNSSGGVCWMLGPKCIWIGFQYCFTKQGFALERLEPSEPLEPSVRLRSVILSTIEDTVCNPQYDCVCDHALFWARERNGDREQEWETPLMASTLVAALFLQNIRPFNHALHG